MYNGLCFCVSRLCSFCCCKNQPEDNYDDEATATSNADTVEPQASRGRSWLWFWGSRSGEQQPLLPEEPRNQNTKRSGYGSSSKLDRMGFSAAFPKRHNAYENRNHLFLRPQSPVRRFGRMRPSINTKPTKRNIRIVSCDFDHDGSVSENKDAFPDNKSVEDKMLDAIVEETAANMIDVSSSSNPIYSHSLTRHEAREKAKWYAERLERLSPSVIAKCVGTLRPSRQLIDVRSQLYRANFSSTHVISQDDKDLMDWASAEVSEGLASIRVPNGTSFVVPFPSLALAKENLTPRSDSL